jgi:aspartate-semialdehyde dehydrogenase
MSYKIAVAGATGNVGREILSILHERNFPASEVVALASANSEGKDVSFGDNKILKAQVLEKYDFSGTDIALFSPGGAVSAIHAPRAAKAGCVVIDNTSHFRMDKDVPLIVPEVNSHDIANYTKRNIIANPNCSTIQMLVALKPLHDAAIIKRIVVSTYQSVSGAGKKAMDELYLQTKGIYTNDKLPPINFTRQIAFNVIPQIDLFSEGGYTKEELKMVNETHKILSPDIGVSATCVRVPVFNCHAESINVEFENRLSADEAREILHSARGVTVIDNPDEGYYATPIECAREDNVFVSRIRSDDTAPNCLNMWVVSDNVRKGAALNAVQIAEELIANYL